MVYPVRSIGAKIDNLDVLSQRQRDLFGWQNKVLWDFTFNFGWGCNRSPAPCFQNEVVLAAWWAKGLEAKGLGARGVGFQGITRDHKGSQGITGYHGVSQGITRFRASPSALPFLLTGGPILWILSPPLQDSLQLLVV